MDLEQLPQETTFDFVDRLRWLADLIEEAQGGPTERSIRCRQRARDLEQEMNYLKEEIRDNDVKY